MEKNREKELGRWLRALRQESGLYLPLAVLLGVGNGLLLVAQTVLLAQVLHGSIMAGQPASEFMRHLLALAGLLGLRALLLWGRERAAFIAGSRLRQQLRQQVLDKLTRLGPAGIRARPAGTWASVALEQVESLHDYYARYLPQQGLVIGIPLLILAVVFPLNWAAGAILLLTAPLIPLFMALVGMGAADANRKNFTALQRLSGHFLDRLQGLATLRLFQRARAEEAAIATASEAFRQRTMAVLRIAFLSSAVLEFFAALSIALLALYFGFSYLGDLDFGHYGAGVSLYTGLLTLMLAPEFYQPLRDLGTHYHARAQALGAADSLLDLLQRPEPLAHGQQTLSGWGDLQARDLEVFALDGSRLLGPLSFDLPAGGHLLLVGASGSGKTSLLNVVLGFLPYRGSLRLAGVELRDLDPQPWRQRLAWLGQEPLLLHGSVRDNLALAAPAADDATLWGLLERVQLAAAIRSRPEGLASVIGENGAGLSVGQAQRLALARALLRDSDLFLLDEPTASLDAATEAWLAAALAAATAGKTCLMATHRLDRLQPDDRLLVLAGGQLVQQGRFAELAAQPGELARLLADAEVPA